LWLIASITSRQLRSRSSNKYCSLPTHQSILGAAEDDGDTDEDEDDDEFAEHLSLRHTISRTTEPELKVDKPRGEVVLVICEELAILGLLGISIANIAINVHGTWHHEGLPLIANLITWVR
jgi:hypothetical protein